MLAKFVYVGIVFAFLLYLDLSLADKIGCKDESGRDVDWFINYKIPKIIDDPGVDIKDGVAYAYILAPGYKNWTLSSKTVLPNSGSMLENTLAAYYDHKDSLTHILYNDDPPHKRSKGSDAHAKGVIVFDEKTGFWLTHSIPKFPDVKHYDYPETAQKHGQTALCVTFETSALKEIIAQLLYINPNIYAKNITVEVAKQLDDKAISFFSKKPAFITKEPFKRIAEFKSIAGTNFFSYAKDNQLPVDLYSNMISQDLKVPLSVQTWRKGSGGVLDINCKAEYKVVDVKAISMTFGKGKFEKSVHFDYTQDHSKWAISVSDKNHGNFVCISDLDRMESEKKKGGGALCFKSSPVAYAFESIIAESDKCK